MTGRFIAIEDTNFLPGKVREIANQGDFIVIPGKFKVSMEAFSRPFGWMFTVECEGKKYDGTPFKICLIDVTEDDLSHWRHMYQCFGITTPFIDHEQMQDIAEQMRGQRGLPRMK